MITPTHNPENNEVFQSLKAFAEELGSNLKALTPGGIDRFTARTHPRHYNAKGKENSEYQTTNTLAGSRMRIAVPYSESSGITEFEAGKVHSATNNYYPTPLEDAALKSEIKDIGVIFR
ncbi:MAG: hypothetical protein CMI18_03585 [Opitutaceae bacterium]|nr:hypothetical protein [Opitutaceae bacterium]|tara:strand:- start:1794 stop:2150 length:357 start_codon:yes stop_codon:yes gene_type:complete